MREVFVLLDEADNFVHAELNENSGRRAPRAAVSWFLRELQTTAYPGRLRFVFAGFDQLGRVFRDPGLGESAFGNWGAQPLNLSTLDAAAARGLVVEPLAALGMLLPDDLAERVIDYTSGHASLILAFGRYLADVVRAEERDWPLNDVPVRFDHLTRVVEEERGDNNFRRALEQTLGLNLDIARAYPLRLLFLALVSPAGLGGGRVLGADTFTATDAAAQLEGAPNSAWPQLPDRMVTDSLELLSQLGLLEQVSAVRGGRAYRFRAWHYVTVLRTRNGFQAELREAAADWEAGGRRHAGEPRCLWTLPDADLHELRRVPAAGPAVLVGLPKSGRGYAAGMLGSPLADGSDVCRLDAGGPDFPGQFQAWLGGPPGQFAVVADPDDLVPWADCRPWLQAAAAASRPLRWVGGPRLAWDLAGDDEVRLALSQVSGLGPLTAAEVGPWTARQLGTEGPGSASEVTPADAEAVLKAVGGLLPALELFREWLRSKDQPSLSRLTARHAADYLQNLDATPNALKKAADSLRVGVPKGLRHALQHLFVGASGYGSETDTPSEWLEVSDELKPAGIDGLLRVLDAGAWLGFVSPPDADGRVRVPHASAVGLIVRNPRFAEGP